MFDCVNEGGVGDRSGLWSSTNSNCIGTGKWVGVIEV